MTWVTGRRAARSADGPGVEDWPREDLPKEDWPRENRPDETAASANHNAAVFMERITPPWRWDPFGNERRKQNEWRRYSCSRRGSYVGLDTRGFRHLRCGIWRRGCRVRVLRWLRMPALEPCEPGCLACVALPFFPPGPACDCCPLPVVKSIDVRSKRFAWSTKLTAAGLLAR